MSTLAHSPRTVPRIRVDCVSTDRDFLELQSEWNPLLMQTQRPVPFLTWEWVSTWWKHFAANSKLFILVARTETGDLVGIAPLHIVIRRAFGLVPVRTVEFLGYHGSAVCSDHLDLLVPPPDQEIVCAGLLEAMMARKQEWDCVAFGDVVEGSVLFGCMSQLAKRWDLTLQPGPQEFCPYLHLPERWDDLLRSMRQRRRSMVTNRRHRRERLAQEFQVHFDLECSPSKVPQQLASLERLHGLAQNRKGEAGHFKIDKYRKFHRDVAERMALAGHLYMARFDCNGTAVASGYGFFLGRRLFYYQSGFDPAWSPHGVSAILLAYIMEDAIERLGATEFDFLRGQENYKYFWTDVNRKTEGLFLWGRSPRARVAEAEFTVRRRLSRVRMQFEKWTAIIKKKLQSNA